MAQRCSVCYHPGGHAINEAIILEGKSNRAIALRYGVSKDSVQHHKTHIPNLLLQARHDMQAYDASNILAKIETLERETLDQLEAAKGDSDIKHVLAAVREQRGNLELAARIAKLINEVPTINVLNAPQWIEVRSAVVEALQAHPSARMAVLRALEGVEERMPSGTPSVAGDLMMALDRVSFARALGFEPDE